MIRRMHKMAELWGGNLTQQNISYFCQKLGITRKKKPMVIKREMTKKEQNFEKNQIRSTNLEGFTWMKLDLITEMIIPMDTALKGKDVMP